MGPGIERGEPYVEFAWNLRVGFARRNWTSRQCCMLHGPRGLKAPGLRNLDRVVWVIIKVRNHSHTHSRGCDRLSCACHRARCGGHCGADAESWWNSAMESAYESGFRSLLTTAACCGARVSLNDLRYPWAAALGRFVLEAMNPNVRDLPPAEEEQLQAALGCDLRKVWVHI